MKRREFITLLGGAAAAWPLRLEAQMPIVFAQVDDPVASGFVASLARPGGNVTGFSSFEESFPVKWLELLKELAPRVMRVSLLYDPANPAGTRSLTIMQTGAASLGIEVTGAAVQDSADIESAINSLIERPNGGLAVLGSPSTARYRDLIVERAARHHLAAIYPYRYFVASGGLVSYGIDTLDLYRRATSYIDRILRGEEPANLPVQQPTKFELVINLKTAKTLGIEVPPTLLARADEVIE